MRKSLFTGPRLILALIVVALGLTVWFMVRKPALEVETALVHRGPMAVTIDDLGETRVRDLYTIAAPVTGELLRLVHKPGAAVKAGDVVAEIQPIQPALIDRRSYDETVARIGAFQADLAAARARAQEARAGEQLAQSTYRRLDALLAKGFVSKAQLDAARSALDSARAARRAADEAADAALHGLRAIEATLRTATAPPGGQAVRVRAPVSGVVLNQLHESGGPVTVSTPLLELGDPGQLEIFSEMLSVDAVKVLPGAAVEIAGWGGDRPLKGRVQQVEPLGFRKISALGVEEQRVRVVIDLVEPRSTWQRLGHGYRVGVRIALWSAPDILQVPIGALFRQGDNWAAYVVTSEGKAQLVRVKVGRMNDETAEVQDGLAADQSVILHPGDKVANGVRVTAAR